MQDGAQPFSAGGRVAAAASDPALLLESKVDGGSSLHRKQPPNQQHLRAYLCSPHPDVMLVQSRCALPSVQGCV